MTRLSLSSLDRVPQTIARPGYAVAALGIGIVHLGIGAFHRAHQAIYTDDALAKAAGPWGICGVSLRSPDVRDRLMPQDGLYTAIEKSPEGTRRRIVGSVREVLFLGDERESVYRRLGGARDEDRVADRHGKRLLPFARDRPPRRRIIRTSCTTCRTPRRRAACRDCWSPRWMRGVARMARRSPSSVATTCRRTVHWSRASSSRSRACATHRLPNGSGARSRFRRRWSTGSCRRPRRPTSSRTMPR